LLQPRALAVNSLGQHPYAGVLRIFCPMAASRLTDSQKQELVQRFRQGETSAELAAAFGCSANTVSRTVKALLAPDEYEQLKQQRGRSGPGAGAAPAAVSAAAAPASSAKPLLTRSAGTEGAAGPALDDLEEDDQAVGVDPDADDAAVLAIDDADDFADDDDPAEDGVDEGEVGGDDETFAAIPVLPLAVSQEPVQVQPLQPAVLPDSLYMLVDKTVELQARPLRDFAELGQLPPEEEERQALQLFVNPRQAKRQCGRSQRVIKMPDPEVLFRRASYLQVKGISRLVVEGTLYALPGS